jgi:methionine-rich copper-binding protein CopC
MTPRNRRRIPAAAAAILAVAAILFGAAPAATAHDALAGATPGVDETVISPITQVQLTFNEAPLAGFDTGIAIAVLDPAGTDVSTGDIAIDNTTLIKAVSPTTPGAYQVLWQTVSADGHPISGQYGFTYAVEPIPTTTTTPTPTETPDSTTAPAETATDAPSETPTETAAADTDLYSTLFPIGLIGGVVVVLAIVAVAIIVSVRSKRRNAEREPR